MKGINLFEASMVFESLQSYCIFTDVVVKSITHIEKCLNIYVQLNGYE